MSEEYPARKNASATLAIFRDPHQRRGHDRHRTAHPGSLSLGENTIGTRRFERPIIVSDALAAIVVAGADVMTKILTGATLCHGVTDFYGYVIHLSDPLAADTQDHASDLVHSFGVPPAARHRGYDFYMLRGIPSLSKNLWQMAYIGLFILLTQSARGAVDGFDDHRWFNGALGVYWSGFIIFLMVARYPNGLRKFPIVEPAPLARRESRGR